MLIDWFTVGAQALNFAILVGLMRRFLYKPVLHAIDERERQVTATLEDADAKETAAEQARGEFKRKNATFDAERAALLSAATDAATAERRRLLAEARTAASDLQERRMEALRRDAHRLNQAIVRRTQDEVFAIARRALSDLATTTLEAQMAAVFERRLATIDDAAKERMAAALEPGSAPAVLRSAFDLPAEERAAIQSAIHQLTSAKVELRFETDPTLVSGVELTAGGQKIAWSIADYLTGLEKGIDELIAGGEAPTTAGTATPAIEPAARDEEPAKAKADPAKAKAELPKPLPSKTAILKAPITTASILTGPASVPGGR